MGLEGGQWRVGKASVSPTGKFVRPKQPAVDPSANTTAKNDLMAKSNSTVAGTFSVDGKPVNLKYAYALRKRKIFDEPEETITILATDKPVAEDVLLKSLSGLKTKEKVQGVLLMISTERSGRLAGSLLHRSFDKEIFNFNNKIDSLSIGKDRVTATHTTSDTEGTHKWNYSVTVDLPFKR
jgi:hypothetical protein